MLPPAARDRLSGTSPPNRRAGRRDWCHGGDDGRDQQRLERVSETMSGLGHGRSDHGRVGGGWVEHAACHESGRDPDERGRRDGLATRACWSSVPQAGEGAERLWGGRTGPRGVGEAIGRPARGRRVTTCVRCQDRFERMMSRLESDGRRRDATSRRRIAAEPSCDRAEPHQYSRPVGDDRSRPNPDSRSTWAGSLTVQT